MTASTGEFRREAAVAVADAHLQAALETATGRFRTAREIVLAELPDADRLRDHLKAVRAATIANLAGYLEQFEQNATAAGAHVHWARDAAEASAIVTRLARERGVTLAPRASRWLPRKSTSTTPAGGGG